MDVKKARQILGVSKNSTFDEVRQKYRTLAKRFHPDVDRTGNATQFTLVSAAFAILQSYYLGDSDTLNGLEMPEEVKAASQIKFKIDKSFDRISINYNQYQAKLTESTKKSIKKTIYSSKSSSDLQQAVNTKIKYELIEFHGQLEAYLEKIINRSTLEDRQFLNTLFNDLYYARRKYWLLNLYRDPFLLISFFSLLIWAVIITKPELTETLSKQFADIAVKIAPELLVGHPLLIAIVSVWWLPVLVIFIGTFYLIISYSRLNPRKQFIPPRLSLEGLTSFIKEQGNNVGLEKSENSLTSSMGVATLFAGVGTVILPGIGTAIGGTLGAIAGGIWGWFSGKELNTIKDEVYSQIIEEFEAALAQLNDRVEVWLSQSKDDLIKATEECFAQNIHRITGLLSNPRLLKYIVDENRMLPPSSGNNSPNK
ncbi:MAG: DnaJ domain-containing protein [Crinalium sp.]